MLIEHQPAQPHRSDRFEVQDGRVVDRTKAGTQDEHALDRRPNEKLKDAAEDIRDGAKAAAKDLKEATK